MGARGPYQATRLYVNWLNCSAVFELTSLFQPTKSDSPSLTLVNCLSCLAAQWMNRSIWHWFAGTKRKGLIISKVVSLWICEMQLAFSKIIGNVAIGGTASSPDCEFRTTSRASSISARRPRIEEVSVTWHKDARWLVSSWESFVISPPDAIFKTSQEGSSKYQN